MATTVRDLGQELEELLDNLDRRLDEYDEYLIALKNLALCSVIPDDFEPALISELQDNIQYIKDNTTVETKTVVKQTHVNGVLVESYTNTCTTREWLTP